MDQEKPEFSAIPSRPRARRWVRVLVYLLMLGIACAAIWWIDRGAMLTNVRSAATAPAQ
jgi:TRAP-type C4-dicarboxylate transport system permease small subunit